MAFKITTQNIGFQPIANIDTGFTPPNGSTAIPTPPAALGTIVKGNDPTFGDAEFILLAGVASTAIGSLVTYNTVSYTTTLCAVGGNVPQPVAVAMSANTSATTFGWYQISGISVMKKASATSLSADVAVGCQATGLIGATAAGKEIEGAVVAAVAAAGTTSVRVLINRPNKQGRIT